MSTKITRDVLESHLNCRYKSHLKLAGQQGNKAEYEVLLTEFAADVRLQAIDKILSGHEGGEVPRNIPLTVSALQQGAAFLLDAILDDDAVCLSFDGLKRVTGASKLGDFHYVPLLFSEEKKVRPEHRILLEIYGALLMHIQGQAPRYGILWHGRECTPTRIKLSAGLRKGEQVLHELSEMRSTASPPRLMLNDHCPRCEFRKGCLARAEEADSLTLLDRMPPKLIKRYEKKGIFTVTQLSYLFRPRRRKAKRMKGGKGFKVELQAFSLRTGKTFLQAAPRLTRSGQELFLDVEGNPDDGFTYLIGLLIRDGEAISYCSFWADRLQDEKDMWVGALVKIREYPGAPVYHYGSYDRKAMARAAKKHQLSCDDVFGRMANVASHIYGQVYFPVRSNGLKDVGKFVGASWTSPNASGLQCLCKRHRWEQTPTPELKEQIVRYNEEDCTALRLVTERLAKLGDAASVADGPEVEFADKPKKQATPAGHDLHDQFDEIIEFAHFDYQNKRILLRPKQTEEAAKTSPTPEKKKRLCVLRRIPRPRANRTVTVRRRRKCPKCRVRLVKSGVTDERIITDLVFTKSGCRKTYFKYIGVKGYCKTCTRHHIPSTLFNIRTNTLGYGFQAWVTYQRVALRQPYEAITNMMQDMFEETIRTSTAVSFVRNLANRYVRAETTLLQRLLASPFIHVDDTKVNIQGEAHYVWVFTDGIHVVFRMTPTREADIVHEVLAGYEGIMVSDFYPGFDSIKCRQQKCLVHLVRDINEELWDNPFDGQLENLAAAVKGLLVPILQDVQCYGLKTRHLHKHRTSVDRFYREVIDNGQFTSDVAARFQARFQRYKERLFLFLEQDSIPWNNNTGERAIRHLAVQRKISGTFFKSFASCYLVLLAVAQTCRFQGKSFLKFLLSGEMDVDLFRPRQRRRRTKPIGEARNAGVNASDPFPKTRSKVT
jgi:predicted RecB family nuclease